MDNDTASAVLHSAWVQSLAREAQVLVGAATDVPLTSFPMVVERCARTVACPSNQAECFAARSILLEGAVAAGAVLHRRVHGRAPHRCDFNASEAAVSIWRRHRSSPASFLREWAAVVGNHLGGDQQVFQQAQEWAARHWSESCSSADAAEGLKVPAATLERIVRRNTGLSFSKYHKGERLVKAIELLATTDSKVDAVAADVGFRSKKNFYKAFKEWIGVTPREFRANGLPADNGWHDRIPAIFLRRIQAACPLRPPARHPGVRPSRTVRAAPGARLQA